MRVRFKFIAKLLCAGLIVISCVLVLVVWGITYHPQPVEPVAVTGTNAAPLLKPGQKLKILSWNVQYLAGKEHVFWYDVPRTYRGPPWPDTRPTRSDLDRTLREVARIIREEDPDMTPLFDQYEAVPSLAEIAGGNYAQWQSHWKNGLELPDRTIDFFFLARSVRLGGHSVRQKDPGKTEYLRISDHFPVIAEITVP